MEYDGGATPFAAPHEQQVKFWHVHKERCSFQYFELVLIDCGTPLCPNMSSLL